MGCLPARRQVWSNRTSGRPWMLLWSRGEALPWMGHAGNLQHRNLDGILANLQNTKPYWDKSMQVDVFHLQIPCPMLIFRSKAQLEQYEEHCSHFKQVPVTEWVKQCWATHCNHGLGFGNPSKRSLFLNRLDHNSDLSDVFWWNIYI